MNKRSESVVRTALLSVAATAIGVGAFLGLPRMKALAAAQEMKAMPRMAQPPVSLLNIVQPSHVNPSARKLVAIADQAVTDQAFASRIFQEPDAVAAEHNLSEHEKLVLRNMTPELFATSQGDATRIGAARLSQAGSRRLPASVTDPKLITGRMPMRMLAALGARRSSWESTLPVCSTTRCSRRQQASTGCGRASTMCPSRTSRHRGSKSAAKVA